MMKEPLISSSAFLVRGPIIDRVKSPGLHPTSQKVLVEQDCTHHRLVLEECVLCAVKVMIVYRRWKRLM